MNLVQMPNWKLVIRKNRDHTESHLLWEQLIQLTDIAVTADPGQFPAPTVSVAGTMAVSGLRRSCHGSSPDQFFNTIGLFSLA